MIVNSTEEVIEMNIPGFTAEASLYNVSARYRATAEASFYGGIVQPAGSDVFDPGGSSVPFLSTQLFSPYLSCWFPYLGWCVENTSPTQNPSFYRCLKYRYIC
jgi:hypothetical protein